MRIYFFIQTDSSQAPIYIRFNDGRKFDIRAKTGIVINPKNWAGEKWKPGFPKTNSKNAESKIETSKVSALLKDIDRNLTERYNSTRDKSCINKEWLARFFSPKKSDAEVPAGLVDYFEYYAAKKRTQTAKTTLVKLGVIKHLLEKMERDTGEKLLIPEIGPDFMTKFLRYSVVNGYAVNTTARNFRFIKTVCYDAEVNGIQILPQLKKLNLKNEKVDKIYLSLEDLALIEKAVFNEPHLAIAKDWLLISCECGQRVSDFMRFKKEMIRIEGGKSLIEFTQKKTGQIMTVPLSKKVLQILSERKGEFPPKMSDQRYNEHIKKVCDYAGINYKIKGSIINPETLRKETGTFEKYKLVTSHIGRRSFATNNYGRIPTSLLIAATGHTTEKMFLEYIGKTDTQKALALAEYF